MKLEKQDNLNILENALSWLVTLNMLVYGFAKYAQFGIDEIPHAEKVVGELQGMELMWAFYGYSKPFAYLLGAFEVTGGLLLLFRKTRLIGAIFLTTILSNIILQDIFFEVNRGALMAAIIYQSCLMVIFFLQREKVVSAFKALTTFPVISAPMKERLIKWGLAFGLFVLLRWLEWFFTTGG